MPTEDDTHTRAQKLPFLVSETVFGMEASMPIYWSFYVNEEEKEPEPEEQEEETEDNEEDEGEWKDTWDGSKKEEGKSADDLAKEMKQDEEKEDKEEKPDEKEKEESAEVLDVEDKVESKPVEEET